MAEKETKTKKAKKTKTTKKTVEKEKKTKKTAAKKTTAAKKSAKETKKITSSEKEDQINLLGAKQNIIEQFALKSGDTGSPEVQVALATLKINKLVAHLDQNPKDNHSRRGLLKIVAKRRRILNYLKNKDQKRYKMLITKLQLKK